MKKSAMLLLCCLLPVACCLLLWGCGVVVNPTYSQLLDQTAALAADDAVRADANGLTADQMKTCLRAEANAWQSFRSARDGKN